MTEILTGKDGLHAALEKPEDWEALGCHGTWNSYSDWQNWTLGGLDVRKFRRIQKPQEAKRYSCTANVYDRVPVFRLPHGQFTEGSIVRVDVTEIINGTEPETVNWQSRSEAVGRERDSFCAQVLGLQSEMENLIRSRDNALHLAEKEAEGWGKLRAWVNQKRDLFPGYGLHCDVVIKNIERLEKERDELKKQLAHAHESAARLEANCHELREYLRERCK